METVSALVLLLLLPRQGSLASSRTLTWTRELVAKVDETSSCVVEREGYSYKPRGTGNWEKKYSGLGTCFEECAGEYEVIVHNTRNDQCYCWKEGDGQLEQTAGNDNLYDLTRCDDTTRGGGSGDSDRDDGSSSSSSSTRTNAGGDNNGSGRTGGAPPAECIRKYDRYTYKPRNGGYWERKYNTLDVCLDECRGEYEIIVHNRKTRDCYCWREEDGELQQQTSGYDDVYHIGNCYNNPSNRAGGDETPPRGWSFDVEEVEYCVEEEADMWTIYDKYVCSGTPDFTVSPGYVVRETEPYDDDDYDVTSTWTYDGSVEQCQALFSLDYWDTLLNPEIRLRSDSWYTHDWTTGTCKLYTDNQSCDRLLYDGLDSNWHSAKYCNFWSK